ncbi:unnamed protein product, partial [Vitis vinifera]|uniref:Uncharacterized protein n=1 Tax=Vitis vinifera TaxID=29760 RepID=D7SMY6_VITVI
MLRTATYSRLLKLEDQGKTESTSTAIIGSIKRFQKSITSGDDAPAMILGICKLSKHPWPPFLPGHAWPPLVWATFEPRVPLPLFHSCLVFINNLSHSYFSNLFQILAFK